MGFALFALAVGLISLFSANILKNNPNNVPILRYIGIAGILIFIIATVLSMFYVVNPGEVGVEVLFGSVQRYAENGLHLKNPLSSVVIFDIKTQREEQRSEGASQDLQW